MTNTNQSKPPTPVTINNTVEIWNSIVVTTDITIVTTNRGINTTGTRTTNTIKAITTNTTKEHMPRYMRLSHVVIAALSAEIFLTMRTTQMIKIILHQNYQKTRFPFQNLNTMPEDLGGNGFQEKDIRQSSSPVHNAIRMDVETWIVHIGRKSHNECDMITTICNRNQKALWDSTAGDVSYLLTVIIAFTTNRKLNCFQAKLELRLPMALLSWIRVNVT